MLLCTCISVLCVDLVIKQLYPSQPDISASRSPTVLVTSSFHMQMTVKRLSTDPEEGLSEHAQCGGLADNIWVWEETQRYCRVQWVPADQQQFLSWQHWTASPEEWKIWGFTHHKYENEWMNESTLGLNFKAKQVSIKMCSFLMSP